MMDPEEFQRRLAETQAGQAAARAGGGGPVSIAPQGNIRYVWMGSEGQSTRIPAGTRTRVERVPRGVMAIDGDPNLRRTVTARESRPGLALYDDLRDIDSVRRQVFEWYADDSEGGAFARWGDYLLELGLIEEQDKRNLTVLDEFWNDALELSARFWEAGEKRFTPHQAIRALAQTGGATPGNGGGGRAAGFTGSRTTTSRQNVDLTNPLTAKALANQALSNLLGRDANEEEIETFKAALNSYERDNPLVTTTTTQYEDGDAVSQTSNTTGGVTDLERSQMIQDDAMQLPEYGAYQAAALYFPAMLQAIQSPV